MTHQDRKLRYLSYRQTAKVLYENRGRVPSVNIVVPPDGTVHIVSNGAYVQMEVWIPRKDLIIFPLEELEEKTGSL